MLSGLGSAVMDTHDSFAKTDRLAAISLILSGVPDKALPVTMLDVDDDTRQAWKATGATPHAALAELIRLSAQSGATGVLLDFDLTGDAADSPADPALLRLIESYPPDAPLLMLVRKIVFSRNGSGPATPVVVRSPYDAGVAGKANVLWVTTLNDIGSDRAVRRIKLWQTVCEGQGGTAYPSVTLVTAARLIEGSSRTSAMAAFLKSRADAECAGTKPAPADWPLVQSESVAVPYVIANNAEAPAQLRITQGGKETVALRRISAGRLVSFANGEAAPMGEIDRDPFAGRVAIIGASYTASADIHETPLGTMPGALILANSVIQAQSMVETVPASPFVRDLLALEIFLIFAVFARYFVGVIALLGIGIVSVIALVALSRIFGFESGVATVAVAITGFALFKLVDALAHIVMHIPEKGFRVFMKS